jgi:hypothetical protein
LQQLVLPQPSSVSVIPLAKPSDAYSGPVKISMAVATKFALKTQAGTITSRELERESGGTRVRYKDTVRAQVAPRDIDLPPFQCVTTNMKTRLYWQFGNLKLAMRVCQPTVLDC